MVRDRVDAEMLEEDEDAASFYKILHGRELSSEDMRRIPADFLRSVSDDFTYRVVLKVAWGSSWNIPLSRIKGCIFMDTCGWENFLRDNQLGDNEFLVFTHEGRMRLNVKIFSKDGMKIVEPPALASPQSSPDDAKGKDILKDVKKEEPECEISDLVETHRGRKPKGGEGLQCKKSNAREKQTIPVRRRSVYKAPESSSFSKHPWFIIEIKRSYLTFLMIPAWFAIKHLPRHSMKMVIHDQTGRTWDVTYLYRATRMTLSAGWMRFAREISLQEGDWCTFELFNGNEMRVRISKTRPT